MVVAPFNWNDAVQWDGPGAIAGCEEILSADRLDRARYAEFLTNYLAAEGKQRNYVLNLNAEWGAGKTWFIKRWYMELKAHYPTVYIDAWQQDFSDDPLLTVISSIIDQLKMIAGKENPIPEGMRQRLLGLFKVGGKLALKAAIKKAGLEDEDFSLEGEEANQLVDALCSNQKERYESIQYLKNEIRQWVEGAVGLSEGELDYPAFILIDELDRCRPSYAVEMLETIKHIFDIPRVVFVLATDTEQLQHSVKAIYGEGFNAQHYLSRFFHRRFILNSDSLKNFIENELVLLSVNVDGIWPCFKKNASLTDFVTMMFEHFSLNLRLTTLVLDRLKIVLLSYSDERELNLPLLLFLISLNEVDTNFYSDVVNFRLDVDEFKLKINMYGTKLHTYIITDAECVDVEPDYISKGATDKRYIYVDHFLINSYHWMRSINHGEIDVRKIMVDILTEEGEYGFQENDWVRMILSELEDDMSIYRILVERSFYLK
ncbi:KAP family P-loop NTPase fold protein [Aeromonas sp. 603757]|uniref:KAP family P-loop NTPase fold protein n=1 Tax=Aeromonas sp. 603757 TaxID=2712050 RepID=UPI003B9FF5FC